jgi:hypothetical protein
VSGGWSRDTRDDIIYPTKGRLQSFGVEVGLPFGDVPYYKANYFQQWFTPLPYFNDFVLMLRADLGYGDGYAGKPLPFFKAFYAGGVGSVRGYQTGRSARRISTATRPAAREDRRERRALLPDPEGRQIGARQRLLRCRPHFGHPDRNTQLSTSSSPGTRISATLPAWASRGIRLSVR